MSEISEKQLEANRENAKLGGVKTEEGKAISKYNALKHGILSREALISGEDLQIFNDFGEAIREYLNPIGPLEEIWTERITSGFWRLRRALAAETKAMEYVINDPPFTMFDEGPGSREQNARRTITNMVNNGDTDKILRYETAIERSIIRALHELEHLQAKRGGGDIPTPILINIVDE